MTNLNQPPRTYNRHLLYTLLGRGECARLGVGNKATLLDRALMDGLPVPSGVVLLDEAWQTVLEHGLVAVHGDHVSTSDPKKLAHTIHLKDMIAALHLNPNTHPLAVRSAFAAEDRSSQSLAGYFTTVLNVDPTDQTAMVNAILAVWSSALAHPESYRRDIMLMEMVMAENAGVLFSEPGYLDDQVNYMAGTAEKLVSGKAAGQRLPIPRRLRWQVSRLPADAPKWAARLQILMPNIRAVFGDHPWDIEWADNGLRCWLVQIRPITRPLRRNETFTNANFKEIMPELPSRFMASLLAASSEGLFGYYRRFDPSLPNQRELIELFRGRPYFNLSLLTDLMRTWGLPSQLVTANLGGQAETDYPFNFGRFLLKTPVLLRQGLDQLIAPHAAKRTMKRLLERTEQPVTSYTDNIELLRWVYTTTVTQMFSLTAAMSGPLQLLRQFGTLAEHNARQQTISTAIYTDLDPLRELVQQHPELVPELQAGIVPNSPAFQAAMQTYLDKHGHRGIYESDIARPRYSEDPSPLLASMLQPPPPRRQPPRRSLLGLLTMPLWWQAARSIHAREGIRYHSMLAFQRIRSQLLTLAETSAQTGQLPNHAALWELHIAEAAKLDSGWVPDAAFWNHRHAEQARLQSYHLPDLLHRFDDLEPYRRGAGPRPTGHYWRGMSLTTGEVQGRAWVLHEPSTALPPGYDPQTTILVAPSIDAGWIATFALVAGVLVETGGDLSHGSIILREIGLPAITNLSGITHALQTGDTLHFFAESGVVERVANP